MSLITEFLTLTCTIRRKTIGISSTSGGNTYTWADASTSVPCSVQVDKRLQAQRDYREDAIVECRVYFESGVDVKVGDRLTSIAEYSGDAFEVTAIGSSDVGNSEYTKITAVLKRGGGTQ
jgi:hypothetical protein